MNAFVIRQATEADIPALRAMQERSLWAIGTGFYDQDVLASFMGQFGTMDFSVVGEGHYFVAVDAAGAVAGSGGWSQRQPGYQRNSHQAAARPDVATVRGVFVDPAFTRRGLGSAIMRHIEADALAHGIRRLGLTATLSGAALYEALGYVASPRRAIDLGEGRAFGCIDMHRWLTPARAAA